jgi:hypothetical protein
MKRAAVGVVAVAAAATLVAGSAPALSSTTGQGLAKSQAANATAGTVTTSTNASVLGLVTLPANVTNTLNALVALPGQVAQPLITGLVTGTGLQAQNGATQLRRPASGSFPSCTGAWAAGNCYGPVVSPISTSVVALSTNALQGYATADSQGFVGAAHAAGPALTLLGINIGNLGVIDSSAECSSASPSVCDTTQKLTGGSLLNGALTYTIANGTLAAQLNGTTLTNGVTLPVAGFGTVKLNGNLLTLALTVPFSNLLSLLNISGLTTTSSSATLTVAIGPGSATVSGSSAKAWGLDVNASLNVSFSVTVSLLGLLGLATLTSTATGNLLDLKLAYSEADAGSLPPGWVPPGLI